MASVVLPACESFRSGSLARDTSLALAASEQGGRGCPRARSTGLDRGWPPTVGVAFSMRRVCPYSAPRPRLPVQREAEGMGGRHTPGRERGRGSSQDRADRLTAAEPDAALRGPRRDASAHWEPERRTAPRSFGIWDLIVTGVRSGGVSRAACTRTSGEVGPLPFRLHVCESTPLRRTFRSGLLDRRRQSLRAGHVGL